MNKTIFSEDYSVLLHELREARQRSGLSQKELADRLGETQSFVSKCERGERRLDVVELRTFCGAMGMPFLDFIAQIDRMLSKGHKRK